MSWSYTATFLEGIALFLTVPMAFLDLEKEEYRPREYTNGGGRIVNRMRPPFTLVGLRFRIDLGRRSSVGRAADS